MQNHTKCQLKKQLQNLQVTQITYFTKFEEHNFFSSILNEKFIIK